MIKLGIMQGRLTPQNGRGIQFFPFDNWENEFLAGRDIGLDEIEWIFDFPDYTNNPLWSIEGCDKINKMIEETDVCIRSVCFDYFMRRPFFKYSEEEQNTILNENRIIVRTVLDRMVLIRAKLLEIPFVDDSSVKNSIEEDNISDFIKWCCAEADSRNLEIGIESDYPPEKFAPFLRKIGCTNLNANYDSGNSSGLGYDHVAELRNLNELVANVHIKDRVKGNGTVKLGTGSANFEDVFSTLKEIGYDKSIILQAARTEDGTESGNILDQLEFVKSYLERYGIE